MKLKLKKMQNRFFSLILIFSISIFLFGQDSLKNQNVEILTPYKPIIDDADKKPNTPLPLKKMESKHNKFKYNLPDKIYHQDYKPSSIKAIAYPKERLKELGTNYTRFGIGYPLNSYLDISLNTKRNKYYESGALFSFNHWQGKINELQRESNASTQLYTLRYFETMAVGIDFNLDLNGYNYYGIDSSLNNLDVNTFEDHKQNLTNVDFGFKLFNHQKNSFGLNYKINGGLNLFQAKERLEQSRLIFNAELKKDVFDQDDISLSFENIFNSTSFDTTSSTQNNMHIRGVYFYNREKLQIKLGLNTVFETNESLYMVPELYSETKLLKNHLIYYTGWTGYKRINNLSEIFSFNPFAFIDSIPRATKHNIKYTGVKGKINQDLSYVLNASYDNMRNKLFFHSYSNDTRKFIPAAINVDLVNLSAELSIKINKQFECIYRGDYYEYDIDTALGEEAWHMPNFKMGVLARYSIKNKLKLSSTIDYWGQTKNKNAAGNVEKIEGFIDASINANYIYRENISFVISLNNLLGKTYNRWANYPVLGFNALVGVHFSF